MSLWIAVPEDDDLGMWWDEPISANTRDEIRMIATARWAGKLPADVNVVIYSCDEVEVLDLAKEEAEKAPEQPARCPHTLDMFDLRPENG